MAFDSAKRAYEAYTSGGQAEGGKRFVPFDQLSPAGQAAWQAACDAARDHASTEEQRNERNAGNVAVATSRDPNVKNQDPSGAQRR